MNRTKNIYWKGFEMDFLKKSGKSEMVFNKWKLDRPRKDWKTEKLYEKWS